MKSKLSRRIASILALSSILIAGVALAAISENTGVALGGTVSLTGPDDVCKQVTNNSPTGMQVYVPGSTAAEWQSFVANPPGGVTLASCGCALPWGGTLSEGQSVTAYQTDAAPYGGCVSETRTCSGGTLSGSYQYQSCAQSCAGTVIGGYCWYMAAPGKSCDNACSAHGGWYDAGCAYSISSAAACKNILSTLGASPYMSEYMPTSIPNMGCYYLNHRNGYNYWDRTACTGSGALNSGTLWNYHRTCSCAN